MPQSKRQIAQRVRLLSITAPPNAADQNELTIYLHGTGLAYLIGDLSIGHEDQVIEKLKKFGPGSVVKLFDAKQQSTSWTAETFDLDQTLDPSRCDLQFTQCCLLSNAGLASWWLRFKPAHFAGDYATLECYAKADDSFGDPGDPSHLSSPSPLFDLTSDGFALDDLLLRNDENAPSNLQFPRSFANKLSAEVHLSLEPSGTDKVFQLRYNAKYQKIQSSLGNGIELDDSVALWQPTEYAYGSDNYREFAFGISGIPTKRVLDCWNRNIAERYLRSLTINQLFSALPTLEYSGADARWEVELALTNTQPFGTKGKDFVWIALDSEGEDTLAGEIEVVANGSVASRVERIRLSGDGNPVLAPVKASQPMLLTQDGAPVVFDNLTLSTEPDSSNRGWQLSLSGGATPGNGQTVRVGAFELDFPTSIAPSDGNRFVIKCSADYGVTAVSPNRIPVIPQVVVTATPSLPLSAVRPASEDDIDSDQYSPLDQQIDPGDKSTESEIQANLRRETAVVFSAQGSTDKTARNWNLLYTEESLHEKKQMVHMTLGYTAPAGSVPSLNDQSVLVLDRNPFTVAEVHFHPLSDTGGSFAVAEWSSRTGAWTILQTADKPSYFLMPPQITGEEVVTDDASYPQGLDDGKTPRLLLGSPTAVTYAPDNLRNFVEVPWNLRRLLTDSSLRVSRLDYEMLYGMPCHTTAPQMRLTEAATLYGAVKSGLPSDPLGVKLSDEDRQYYLKARLYWSCLFREYQSRIGVFVTQDPTNVKDPSDFRDSTYTACELRLKDWQPHTGSPTVIDPYLTPSEISADYAHPDFKGGALAGVNQPNIFTGILVNRNPGPGHAAVLDPRFSALGGFGTTQGMFDNDRSTLINTVSMGRTVTYSVERIGRIGCFWNRAKHVIVYQRTVVPTRQFYLSQEKSKFAGRPLVRKVEEYVEFLQEERIFAKDEIQPPLGACIKGFKCGEKKRFPVNSTWGATVPGQGWKVPLWNPTEAAILPDVYPKPQLFVEVSTPEKTPGSSVDQPTFVTHACQLTQPQEVFFYTSTEADDTADTDHWNPVESVDWVKYPLCVPDTSIYEGGDLNQKPLPEFSIPPGWEPVSFTIEAPPTGVHVTDGIISQNGSPIAANIKTITVNRGGASQTQVIEKLQGLGSYGQGRAAAVAMQNGFADLRALITAQPPNSPASDAVEAIKAKLSDLKNNGTQLAGVATSLLQNASGTVKDALKQAETTIDKQFSANASAVQAKLKDLSAAQTLYWKTEFQRVQDMIQAAATEAANWTEQTRADLLDKTIQSWGSELEQSVGALTPLRSVILSFVRAKNAVAEIQRLLTQIPAQASAKDIDLQLRPIARRFSDMAAGLSREFAALRASIPTLDTTVIRLTLNTDQIQNQFDAILQALGQSLMSNVTATVSQGLSAIKSGCDQLKSALDSLLSASPWKSVDLLSQADLIQKLLKAASLPDLQTQIRSLNAKDLLQSVVGVQTDQIQKSGQTLFRQLSSSVNGWMTSQATNISQTLTNLGSLAVDPTQLRALQDSLDQYAATLAATAEAVDQNVRQQIAGLYNAAAPAASSVMQLVRAFGDPPQVPQLTIEPPAVAYVYNWAASKLPITPVLARANQVEQALNALGVNVPAIGLDQALVPPDLSHFDLNKIFSNFAGLQLKNLFSGVKLPTLSEQQFNVTHGWEPQSRRAWLQAVMSVPIPQRLVVFQASSLALCITDSHFNATCRIESDGTTVHQAINGTIGGTLGLEIGDSNSLIKFLESAVVFDDSGKLQFQFHPEKIKLADALQAVSALVNLLSGKSKNGFTYGPTAHGVKCAFALPVPDTSALTSGISGLSFSTSLELAAADQAFDITLGLGISSKDRPFNFAVFILGGCGYVSAGVTYHISTHSFSPIQLELAIGASASLAIALGPISGGVYAQFGIELLNSGSGFRAAAFFQISGHVSMLGMVSIDIVLRLEASYYGGVMQASGHVEYEVKLFMFSISVSKDVSMSLGPHGQSSMLERPSPNLVASLSGPNDDSRAMAEAFAAADGDTNTPAFRYVSMLL